MLPGGLRTAISGIGVFYPDKRPTQRIGIVPDVEVRPTIAGIRAGRDEVLEEGLRQILGRDVPADQIREDGRAFALRMRLRCRTDAGMGRIVMKAVRTP